MKYGELPPYSYYSQVYLISWLNQLINQQNQFLNEYWGCQETSALWLFAHRDLSGTKNRYQVSALNLKIKCGTEKNGLLLNLSDELLKLNEIYSKTKACKDCPILHTQGHILLIITFSISGRKLHFRNVGTMTYEPWTYLHLPFLPYRPYQAFHQHHL